MEQQPAGFIGEIMSYKVHLNRTLIDIARIYIFSPLDWPSWVLINMYQGRVLSPLSTAAVLWREEERGQRRASLRRVVSRMISPPDAAVVPPLTSTEARLADNVHSLY